MKAQKKTKKISYDAKIKSGSLNDYPSLDYKRPVYWDDIENYDE